MKLDMSRAALLVVDVTKAHFDYEFNYLPVPKDDCERVLKNLQEVIPEFRKRNLPVIYVRTGHKINPITGETRSMASTFWKYQMEKKVSIGGNTRRPINTENSPAMEIMPQLDVRDTDIIIHKQRYSAFMGTPLEMYLRVMGIDTLFFTGANTNNCVLCSAYEAYNRDIKVVVVENCCASMNGKDFHELAIKQMRAALGWIVETENVADILDNKFDF